jgi:hypothetical protein
VGAGGPEVPAVTDVVICEAVDVGATALAYDVFCHPGPMTQYFGGVIISMKA